GKTGWGIARLKRWLRLEDYAFDRDLAGMTVDVCPFEPWQGHKFDDLLARVLNHLDGSSPLSGEEKELIESAFSDCQDEADFMLCMLREFDVKLSWHTITANRDMKTVRRLLMDPLLLPGFNDSGAHITNMAFYDVNLRSLRLAMEGGDADLSYMVKRLTQDPAQIFDVDRGTIFNGDIADIILVDPKALSTYEGEDNVRRIFREEYQHQQLVNRSDDVVPLVLIGGKIAWQKNEFSAGFGKEKMGSLLRRSSINEQIQLASAA
ncbi:MAG: N-acyl-D-glutamate deacylase, partial [Pseudomonadota bacterium]